MPMLKSAWSKVSGRMLFGAALCLAFSVGAVAQQADQSAVTHDQTSQQLLERISQLEAKVKQLEEKQTAVPSLEPAPQPVVEAPATKHDRTSIEAQCIWGLGLS